jgi:type II secretory pathway component PulF
MKRFKFKAKNDKGQLITGEVEASTDSIAAKLVREKGLIIINILPKKEFSLGFLDKYKNRVTAGGVVNFTRQLSTMVNAGLPITESLLILRSQSEGAMQGVVSQILVDVEEGESLSKAMSKFPRVFNKTYIALIKSGELGGVIDKVLTKLSDNLEKQAEFKGRVKGALIYPVIIVIGMVAVATIMLIFVVPKLTSLYDQFDADLPITTRLLITVSDTLNRFWYIVFGGAAALIYGFKAYRNTTKGKRIVDSFILKMPLMGDLQRQVLLADITRTLGLMVSSGVSILEALNIASEVVSNNVISEALTDSAKMVEKGFPISYSLSRHPEAFPYILSQMVSVGEETGQMDEVLNRVSHVFEVESDQKLKAVTAAVEPMILIVLGVGVAFLVISIILPIYNLTTQL